MYVARHRHIISWLDYQYKNVTRLYPTRDLTPGRMVFVCLGWFGEVRHATGDRGAAEGRLECDLHFRVVCVDLHVTHVNSAIPPHRATKPSHVPSRGVGFGLGSVSHVCCICFRSHAKCSYGESKGLMMMSQSQTRPRRAKLASTRHIPGNGTFFS